MPHPGFFLLRCCCAEMPGSYCGCAFNTPCALVACDGFSTAFPLAATINVAGSTDSATIIGGGGNIWIRNVPTSYAPAAGGGAITIDTLAKAIAYTADGNGYSAVKYDVSNTWTGGTIALGPDDYRTLGPGNGGCLAQAIGYYRKYQLPGDDEPYVFDGLMDGMPRFSGSATGTLYKNPRDANPGPTGSILVAFDREAEWNFKQAENARYVVKAWATPYGASEYVDPGGAGDGAETGLAAVELAGYVGVSLAMEIRERLVQGYYGSDGTYVHGRDRTSIFDNWTSGGGGAFFRLALGLDTMGGYIQSAGLFGYNAAAYNTLTHACCKTESLPTAWGDATTSGSDQFGAATTVTVRPTTVSSATIAKATPSDPGCRSAPRWIRVVLTWQAGTGGAYTETYRVELIMVQTCGPAIGPFVPGPFGGGTGGPTYSWPTACVWSVFRVVSSTLTSAEYGEEDWGGELQWSLERVSPILWRMRAGNDEIDPDVYQEWGALQEGGGNAWSDTVFRYIKHASTSPVGMTDIEKFPTDVDANPATYIEYDGSSVEISRRTYSGYRAMYVQPASIAVTETTPESDLNCACDCPSFASMNQAGYAPIALTRTSSTPCTYTGTGASVAWDSTNSRWVATRGSDVAYRAGNPLGIYTHGGVTINVG